MTPARRTIDPSRTLGDSPLGQGGQILGFAVAPRAERIAVLGNHHVISVVDVAGGRITATLPCQSSLRTVAFDGDEHVLAFDSRGLVRLAMDGSSEVVIARPWGGPNDFRALDMLVHGETVALIESRGYMPQDEGRAQLFHAGRPVATIAYTLAEHAAALGLTGVERCVLVVNAAGLSPDGERLVALASVVRVEGEPQAQVIEAIRGAVLIHDTRGRLLHAHATAEAPGLGNDLSYFPGKLAFAPDGRRFAVARGTVRVFDGETGAVVSEESLRAVGDVVHAREVAILDGGELLVAGERCVGRWSPGASEATVVRAFRERAFVLAMAAARTAVAIADDRALLLFALPGLEPMHAAVGHTKAVGLLAVDRTGASVASSDGSSLIVWDVAAGVPRFRIAARSWAGLAFSPDGQEVMAPIDGQRPHVLDAQTGEVRAVGQAWATAIQWGERVTCLHYDEVMRDEDGIGAEIIVSEGREARETKRLPGPYLRCVPALSRDGRRALVWSDMVAYGWDLARGEQLWTRPLDVVQAALSPDGAFAVVTQIGGPPAVIDMATGEERLVLQDVGSTISWAVAWSAQQDRIAVGVDDGDVYVAEVDVETWSRPRLTRLATGHTPGVSSAAFSGDGNVVVTGGTEGKIRVFELGARLRLARG